MARILDPTRTTTLRGKFVRDMARRLRRLQLDVKAIFADGGAFFLRSKDDASLRAFKAWLKSRLQNLLLTPPDLSGRFWTDAYVDAAYKRGILNAYREARPDPSAGESDVYAFRRDLALSNMTQSQAGLKRLRLLRDHAADEVEDVSRWIATRMGRTMTAAISAKKDDEETLAELLEDVRKGMTMSALPLARSEIIYVHAEAQLDLFEALGHTSLRLISEALLPHEQPVEKKTIVANKIQERATLITLPGACEQCVEKSYRTYSIRYARGLLPIHKNCRCSWGIIRVRV